MSDFIKIKTGSKFETSVGYSRAVVVGDWIFVSLTAGIDYSTRQMPDTAAAQLTLALKNINAALTAVGSSLNDVVKTQVFVPDPADLEGVLDAFGQTFRGIDPALTITHGPLAGDYKVEIEVTAYRGVAEAGMRQIDVTP